MATRWRALAEQVVHARPTSDDDAQRVLEWVAQREDKSLAQLLEELDLTPQWPWPRPREHRSF